MGDTVSQLLTRVEASAFLKERGARAEPTTLQTWVSMGVGPKYVRIQGRSYYRVGDLLAWLSAIGIDAEADI